MACGFYVGAAIKEDQHSGYEHVNDCHEDGYCALHYKNHAPGQLGGLRHVVVYARHEQQEVK